MPGTAAGGILRLPEVPEGLAVPADLVPVRLWAAEGPALPGQAALAADAEVISAAAAAAALAVAAGAALAAAGAAASVVAGVAVSAAAGAVASAADVGAASAAAADSAVNRITAREKRELCGIFSGAPLFWIFFLRLYMSEFVKNNG